MRLTSHRAASNAAKPALRVSWAFALLCLVVIVAVFAWGTAYKISLYRTLDGPTFPHVKMGTTSDGPMKRAIGTAVLALAVLPCLAALKPPRQMQRVARSWITPPRPATIAKQPQLFFRPPPRVR